MYVPTGIKRDNDGDGDDDDDNDNNRKCLYVQ